VLELNEVFVAGVHEVNSLKEASDTEPL